MSHVSLPFSAAVEVRGRSAKIQLRRVVSGHFRPSQSWKDEKSHKVVPIKPKAMSWADSRFVFGEVAILRGIVCDRRELQSHTFPGQSDIFHCQGEALLMTFQTQHFRVVRVVLWGEHASWEGGGQR